MGSKRLAAKRSKGGIRQMFRVILEYFRPSQSLKTRYVAQRLQQLTWFGGDRVDEFPELPSHVCQR
eukprot:10200534-Lingulodinium_polyedra.AAC.1